jgi:uncharacterized DUF497 family protein
MFAWDEAERRADLRKHGIDFADAEKVFTVEDDRESYGEQRFLTLGLLEDQVVSVTHTERGDTIRIIPIREATKDETRFYFSQITD